MPKSSPDFKTLLIVLAALIALFVCIFFAMKLLSLNNAGTENNTEAPRASNGTLILRAVDGDTLELADGEGEGEIIRLLCVDAPELGDAGYEEAKDYLSSLLVLSGTGAGEGEDNIRIERQGIDKYNRTLAWIYSGETLINKEIIAQGYGEVFPYEGMDCGRVE
jgi:endonuclease YncB( thermonuclease family)